MVDLFGPRQGPNVLHNYTDIITGRSFQELIGWGSTITGPVKDYHLGGFTPTIGNPIREGAVATSSSFTKVLDIDFDIDVNRTISMQGKGTINILQSFYGGAGGGNLLTSYLKIRLRKYHTTTETEIASVQSVENNGTPGAGVFLSWRLSLPISIPKATFQTGSILRITVEVWAKYNIATSEEAGFHFDPVNTAVDSKDSIFKIYLPFIVPE